MKEQNAALSSCREVFEVCINQTFLDLFSFSNSQNSTQLACDETIIDMIINIQVHFSMVIRLST